VAVAWVKAKGVLPVIGTRTHEQLVDHPTDLLITNQLFYATSKFHDANPKTFQAFLAAIKEAIAILPGS
jgi:ABC-type nitrate/sulfonate/bicarbonate transport system substrate-binding protein